MKIGLDRRAPSHEDPLTLLNKTQWSYRFPDPTADPVSLMRFPEFPPGDKGDLERKIGPIENNAFLEGNLAEGTPDQVLDLRLSQRDPFQWMKTTLKQSGDGDPWLSVS